MDPFRFLYTHPASDKAQSLVVAESKHLYALKSGALRYSEKKLSASCSSGTRIRYCLVAGENTGAFYGEASTANTPLDLAGFLTRAWHPKPWYFYSGVPSSLTVPRALLAKRPVRADLERLASALEIRLAPPQKFPPWYAHLVRDFDQNLSGMWVWLHDTDIPWSVEALDLISTMTTLQVNYPLKELWDRSIESSPLRAIPEGWPNYMDQRDGGVWRERLHQNWPPVPN